MSTTARVTRSLLSAPLPQIIETLGVSIAEAQAALDRNSVRIADEMVKTKVGIGDNEYSLIALGFTPTFYAFTEATVEAKLSFTMAESSEFGISVGAQAGGVVGPVMFAASVDVSYARKFSVSAEGSSSIAARIVSLPAPDILSEILRRKAGTI
jgi:hypothetical protein